MMKIFTPGSLVYSMIDLCDFKGLQVLQQEHSDGWELVAYRDDEDATYVCIQKGTREELDKLTLAISQTGTDSRFCPTTPTFH